MNVERSVEVLNRINETITTEKIYFAQTYTKLTMLEQQIDSLKNGNIKMENEIKRLKNNDLKLE